MKKLLMLFTVLLLVACKDKDPILGAWAQERCDHVHLCRFEMKKDADEKEEGIYSVVFYRDGAPGNGAVPPMEVRKVNEERYMIMFSDGGSVDFFFRDGHFYDRFNTKYGRIKE